MPYLLGLLGTIVTALVLLKHLADSGIDLGGLNPFLLRRRRSWRQKFEANPIFSLEDPMEVAAVLAVGVAKADGDMSAEQKQVLLMSFERTFGLDQQAAMDLLVASAHLVGDGRILRDQVHDVVAPSKQRFSDSQVESTLLLVEETAAVEGPSTPQQELVASIRDAFRDDGAAGAWN